MFDYLSACSKYQSRAFFLSKILNILWSRVSKVSAPVDHVWLLSARIKKHLPAIHVWLFLGLFKVLGLSFLLTKSSKSYNLFWNRSAIVQNAVWKMHVLFLCGSKPVLLFLDVLLCTQNTAKDINVCFSFVCISSVKLTFPTLPESQYYPSSASQTIQGDLNVDQEITCAVSPLSTKITGQTFALKFSMLSGLNFSNYLPELKIFWLSQPRYYIPFLDFCVFLPTFKKSNGPDRGLVSIALSPSQNLGIFFKSNLSKYLNGNVMSRFFQNQKFVPTADALCYLRT